MLLQYFHTMFCMHIFRRCSDACLTKHNNKTFFCHVVIVSACVSIMIMSERVGTSARAGGGVGQFLSSTDLGRVLWSFIRKE